MWDKTLPPRRGLSIALALVLLACSRGPHTPRGPSAARAGPFAALVRDSPYRAPPRKANPGSIAQIAAAPTGHQSERRVLAPMALTASDGAGLEMTRLEARAVVDSMLAFTELRLSFSNPEPRVREGRFTLQLPPSAAISRLAMKVDGSWQEAEVVERRQANRVYEDFLHQRQDPALLENKAGNEFSARVFPIPAHATKEIIVSYSEELERQEYRLPLAGMPRIKELVVRAQVQGEPGRSLLLESRTEHLVEHDFVPDRDFRMTLEKPFVALAHGQLAAIPIRVPPRALAQTIETLAIAFDTSASRALDLAEDVKRLGELVARLAALHPQLELVLVAFDQELRPVFRGKARSFDPRALDGLLDERALGASDLSIALEALHRSQAPRVALFTDAIPTATALEPRALAEPLRRLEARGARLDVIVAGAAHDRETARALVRGGGRVLGAELSATELAERLSLGPASEVVPSIANAEWVQPRVLDGLVPGETRTLHARLKHPIEGPLRVTLSSLDRGASAPSQATPLEVLTIPARAGERVLIERSVAGAEIRRVTAELAASSPAAAERATLKGTVIDLSQRYRVLSDWTALLVLETDGDYARFGIDRTALSDILGVGDQGLVRVDRAPLNTNGWRLEQLTEDAEPLHAGKALGPPRQPEAVWEDGYGYEFSADPLSETLHSRPSAGGVEPNLQEICAIDPAACPSLDMNKERNTGQLAATDAVHRVRTCRSGSLRRWATGVPREVPCETPRQERSQSRLEEPLVEPYAGRFAEVMRLIVSGEVDQAQRQALSWRDAEPLNTLALVALGEVLEAAGKRSAAARAYGSLIDLYPSRADMRRFAAGRLERVGAAGRRLSEDSYRRALEQRADHVTSHQLLAYSLLRQGRAEAAFSVLEALALSRGVPSHELREDLRLFAAVLALRAPEHRARALALLERYGIEPEHGPSTRLVLTWETDTNDVDLHLVDRNGEHAYYERPALPDGSSLLTDVTSGYGPEAFLIAPNAAGAPYQVFVHYYASGPMGFGMGKVDVIAHDGKGNVSIDTRPFLISNENATVHLGQVDVTTSP